MSAISLPVSFEFLPRMKTTGILNFRLTTNTDELCKSVQLSVVGKLIKIFVWFLKSILNINIWVSSNLKEKKIYYEYSNSVRSCISYLRLRIK